MGVVTLQKLGLIYEDSFDSGTLDPRWEAVPNDSTRWSLSEVPGSLRLKHGADPLYLFLPELTDEKQFVLDIKNIYNPEADSDTGGIVIYTSADDYIALEEYFNTANGTVATYPWLRIVRDYNTYVGYWSDDGVLWNILGSEAFDRVAPRIGLFLAGGAGQSLDVESIRIVRSLTVKVDNVSAGTQIELLDNTGAVVATKTARTFDSSVLFDLASAMTGRFRVTLPDTSVFETTATFNINPGDSYKFDPSLDLYFIDDGVDVFLETNLEEFLGYLRSIGTYSDKQLIVRNPFNGTFNNTLLRLVQYNGTNHYSRLVQLAPDVAGVPGTFSNQLTIGTIGPSAQSLLWARLSRETDPTKFTSEVYFGLALSSQLTY